MTIGSYEASVNSSDSRNPDFDALIKCRDDVCKKFNLDFKQVELSMGMSHDFDQAVSYFQPHYLASAFNGVQNTILIKN